MKAIAISLQQAVTDDRPKTVQFAVDLSVRAVQYFFGV